jgi:hypothetical protein
MVLQHSDHGERQTHRDHHCCPCIQQGGTNRDLRFPVVSACLPGYPPHVRPAPPVLLPFVDLFNVIRLNR